MSKNYRRELNNLIAKLTRLLDKSINFDNRISYYRLAIFLVNICGTLIAFFYVSDTASIIFFIATALVFGIIAHQHSKLNNKIKRLKKWIAIQKENLARQEIRWDSIPFIPTEHESPNSIEYDLNIVGRRSLLHLLSTTSTPGGGKFLRSLLNITDPKPDDIVKRQALIRELKHMDLFRDKLLLHSRLSAIKSAGSNIDEWLNSKSDPKLLRRLSYIFTGYSFLNIILVLLSSLGVINDYWTVTVSIYILGYFAFTKKIAGITTQGENIKQIVGRYSSVFDFIEFYNYKSNSLIESYVAPIRKGSISPSRLFKSIKNYVDILLMRGNPFVWFPMILVFPFDFYLGYKITEKKMLLEDNLETWLKTWYELEGYCSLANFAALNPDYNFPQILKEENHSLLETVGMGHPLIPKSARINNDFLIEDTKQIFIITGSNMSGKSTFLRTVGINICLAYAGAPTDSTLFKLGLMKIFSCINVSDSVVDGISYFYAEVRRLKELVELIEQENTYPILFLIDEIFKGTNNIERLKGSQAYISMLSGKNVAGLIATHDLELTTLSEKNSSIQNFHFREDVKDNKMIFNYNIQKGPCPTTNALKIMQVEGLPVKTEE